MSRDRSPARAKKRERARDRFDAFGENQKAARRNIPLKRARVERAHRRAVTVELLRGEDSDTSRIARTKWRKWPGPTVDEGLAAKRERRSRLEQSPRRTTEVRDRRSTRRRGSRR